MISVIDYGLGNLGSIVNMLKRVGVDDAMFASTPDDIARSDKIILPGVGSFDTGMNKLNSSGLREALDIHVREKHKPILGICLGMQMLGNRSEEGSEQGLGYIDFVCYRFSPADRSLRVPHMGWDYVEINKDTPLTASPMDDPRFYFVHSYYAVCSDESDILFSCEYGNLFTAGVNRDNIYGVQFHPEKSHSYGKWLMKNFAEMS